MILLLGVSYLLDRQLNKRLSYLLVAITLMYTSYNIGLLAMYLVSMPTQEALYLAGYERYMSTIVHFILGTFCIGTSHFLSKNIHNKDN